MQLDSLTPLQTLSVDLKDKRNTESTHGHDKKNKNKKNTMLKLWLVSVAVLDKKKLDKESFSGQVKTTFPNLWN